MTKQTFFAIHRQSKTAIELNGFESWEMVQGCFRSGFLMPDGRTANGIGRCSSAADLIKRARHSGFNLSPASADK